MAQLKTGIHAKSIVLPTEKRADLEELTEEYYHRHQPASPEARMILDDLIYCEWTLRRMRHAETELYMYQNTNRYADCDPEPFPLGRAGSLNHKTFSSLQYPVDATRRAIRRNLEALKELQAEANAAAPVEPTTAHPPGPAEHPSLSPSPQTPTPQIGFVPSTPIPTPPQPANPDPVRIADRLACSLTPTPRTCPPEHPTWSA